MQGFWCGLQFHVGLEERHSPGGDAVGCSFTWSWRKGIPQEDMELKVGLKEDTNQT